MNYEKRYKEALERARDLMTNQNPPAFDKDLISIVFPELAESEDERIRKTLIELVRCNERSGYFSFNNIETSSIIAWLEKQKQIDEEEFKQGALKYVALQFMNWLDKEIPEDEMCLSNAECKVIEDAFLREDWTSISHYMQEKLEKQGGQKPADKVEPKFKVGDWVVYNYPHTIYPICQIIAINENCIVELKDLNGKQFQTENHDLNTNYHLWTIADAKDGDILMAATPRNCPFIYRKTNYNNNLAYYYAGINGNGDFCEGCLKRRLYHFGPVANITPATKEQRDLLFRKMKEAGYKWDAKNKCLCTIN